MGWTFICWLLIELLNLRVWLIDEIAVQVFVLPWKKKGHYLVQCGQTDVTFIACIPAMLGFSLGGNAIQSMNHLL